RKKAPIRIATTIAGVRTVASHTSRSMAKVSPPRHAVLGTAPRSPNRSDAARGSLARGGAAEEKGADDDHQQDEWRQEIGQRADAFGPARLDPVAAPLRFPDAGDQHGQ